MKHTIVRLALAVCALLSVAAAQVTPTIGNSTYQNFQSFVAGKFVANNYNYGNPTPGGQSSAGGQVVTGNAVAASSTIVLRQGYIVLPDGRSVMPYAVGVPIVINDAAPELIVPTAVSGCYKTAQGVGGGADQPFVTCTITAVFAAVHGAYATTASGTGGAAEAELDAFNWGGGVVILAPGFNRGLNTSCTGCYATQNAMMAALLPFHSVSFEDDQQGPPVYWNLTPANDTFPGVPTVLTGQAACDSTHNTCSDATAVGTWTAVANYVTYCYVDVMGNETQCSTTTNFTAVVSKAIDVFYTGLGIPGTGPAASTGMVGYTLYIGPTNLATATQVPLVNATTGASLGVCTLTKIETITPACAVVNATYGQAGSSAQVATITLNTSPVAPLTLGGASTTTHYVPNSNAHTVYTYTPGTRIALPGIVTSSSPFSIVAAAPASTVPAVLGTITLPAGYMNFAGKTIEICGDATEVTAGSTSTVTTIQFWWDAYGSDTATGVPILIGGPSVTSTLVTSNADFWSFCQDITTTVASASATGGSLQATYGFLSESYGAGVAGVGSTGPNLVGAAVGSLNLAGWARIHVVYLHTTGTDGAAPTLENLTVKALN